MGSCRRAALARLSACHRATQGRFESLLPDSGHRAGGKGSAPDLSASGAHRALHLVDSDTIALCAWFGSAMRVTFAPGLCARTGRVVEGTTRDVISDDGRGLGATASLVLTTPISFIQRAHTYTKRTMYGRRPGGNGVPGGPRGAQRSTSGSGYSRQNAAPYSVSRRDGRSVLKERNLTRCPCTAPIASATNAFSQ